VVKLRHLSKAEYWGLGSRIDKCKFGQRFWRVPAVHISRFTISTIPAMNYVSSKDKTLPSPHNTPTSHTQTYNPPLGSKTLSASSPSPPPRSSWGPTPSSSARGLLRTPLLTGAGQYPKSAETLRTPHLTGSSRLSMARKPAVPVGRCTCCTSLALHLLH
jgi:hypothetical protein